MLWIITIQSYIDCFESIHLFEDGNGGIGRALAEKPYRREAEGKINLRQKQVLLRLFHAGFEGFAGGLSAKNYMSITGAPIATTTRDLNDLVKKNILKRTGELKATRYFLNLDKA